MQLSRIAEELLAQSVSKGKGGKWERGKEKN